MVGFGFGFGDSSSALLLQAESQRLWLVLARRPRVKEEENFCSRRLGGEDPGVELGDSFGMIAGTLAKNSRRSMFEEDVDGE